MTGRRLFVSYGHDEHARFAFGLVDALEARKCSCWIDREALSAGRDWTAEIEKGIKSSDAVILLMTPYSVGRHNGVCLDEVAFARALGKTIIPVRVAPVDTPLLVSRLQWIDATDYGTSCDRLDDVLQSTAAQIVLELSREVTSSVSAWSAALDYLFRSVATEGYNVSDEQTLVGRQWLLDELATWVAKTQAKTLWISGAPGIGKSALARIILARLPGAVALHSCGHYDERLNDPRAVVLSLAAQMARTWPAYREALTADAGIDNLEDAGPDTLFRLLLCDIPRRLQSAQPRVLVVDGLDEAGTEDNQLASLCMRSLGRLPPQIRMIMTGRDTPSLRAFLGAFEQFTIAGDDPRHIADLRSFCFLRLPAAGDSAPVIDELVQRSEGNFLFLRSATDWIARQGRSASLLHNLPPNLIGIYGGYLERCVPDRDQFEKKLRPLLEVLIACRQPPTAPMLAELLKVSTYDVTSLLDRLGPLIATNTGQLTPFHKSFLDWLVDPQTNPRFFVQRTSGEQRLISALDRDPVELASWQDYLALHGIHHLWQAGLFQKILDLVAMDWGKSRDILVEIITDALAYGAHDRWPHAVERMISVGHPFLRSGESFGFGRKLVDGLLDRRAVDHLRTMARRASSSHIGGPRFGRYIELRIERALGNTGRVIQLGSRLLEEDQAYDNETVAEIHDLVGDGYREAGHHTKAHHHYAASLARIKAEGHSKEWFSAASALADLAYVAGNFTRAREQCRKAIDISGRIDAEPGHLLLPFFRVLGQIAYVSQQDDEALRHFENTLAIAMAGRRPFRELEARSSIAEAAVRTAPERARRELQLARTLAGRHEARLELGKTYYVEGQLLLRLGEPSSALAVARRGHEILTEVGYRFGRTRCRLVMAEAHFQMNQTREAIGNAMMALNDYKRENTHPAFRLQSLLLLARCGKDQPWFSHQRLKDEIAQIAHLRELPFLDGVLAPFELRSEQ
jgi:tetratricopeptide (TPR) repeat protein